MREQWFIEYCVFSFAMVTRKFYLAERVAKTLKALDKKMFEDNSDSIPRLVTAITKDGVVVDTITTTFIKANHFICTSEKGDYILEMKFGLRMMRKVEQRALSSYGVAMRIKPGIIRDHD